MGPQSAAGKRIVRFMRSVPSLKAIVADYLAYTTIPKREACVALGRRLRYMCGAWQKDVPERMYHTVLEDASVIQNIPHSHDPLVKDVAQAAERFTGVLRSFLANTSCSSRGRSLCNLADFRAELDAALQSYLREHTTYHLRREAMLVRQLAKRKIDAGHDEETRCKKQRLENEIERCYGKEVLDWVDRVAVPAAGSKKERVAAGACLLCCSPYF